MTNLRTLGNSDLAITPVGLGTWAIGGKGPTSWGPQKDKDSIAAIRRALELGINWIDTAPIYGLGHAEKVVAKALKGLSTAERPFVFTKCGLVWDRKRQVSHCLKPQTVRDEIEQSLKRLKVDVLDLVQIHWPALPKGAPSPDIEAAWETLDTLVHQGKIRHIGVSNFDESQLLRIGAIEPVTSNQPPYSMLMREAEEGPLPYCKDAGIGVLVYSPMHSGLLTDKTTRAWIDGLPNDDWRKTKCLAFRDPLLSQVLELVDLLRAIGARHGRTVCDVAVAWTLANPAVTGAIVGARRPDQLDGFLGAMEFRLADDELAEIRAKLPDSVELFG